MPPIGKLLTIPELAERLRISKRSAYRVVREMTHATLAGRLVVPETAVERYIAARLVEPAQEWRRSPSSRGASATSSCQRPIEVRTKLRAK